MNKQQLAAKIWESANQMRSKIEANEYKDYILGFIFYKYLSDNELRFAQGQGMSEKEIKAISEDDSQTADYIKKNLGYFIAYKDLFSTWLAKGNAFDVSDVRDALSAFSRLINPAHKKIFTGIFDTLQTGLSKLGDSAASQTKAINSLLHLIKDIPMDGKQGYDVLGFIYEYLIGMFAANAGKKAGEFYTPHEVSLLMSEIVAHHLRNKKEITIYDPTSGSGSLLINIGRSVARHMKDERRIKYYAQELKQNTYNLTRMNLVMRGILVDNIVTRNGDTLESDWPYFEENDPIKTYDPLYVDAVVSNPPYSQKWDPTNKESDPRYARFGLAPKSKADYAFLLHELFHLKPEGIMTIVLPHGVLFRGGEEGEIRRKLVEGNHIDAIIGLPANIFFGTGIPTIVMALRQKRETTDVLIVDASKGFVKEGKSNKLRASDIKRISDTVIERRTTPKYSRVVAREEIRENGYNLNIPRYVDSSEGQESWDIYATMFGGIPHKEIDALELYWAAFPGLRAALFSKKAGPYAALRVKDVKAAIRVHPDVQTFVGAFETAFAHFDRFLKKELIGAMLELDLSAEEEALSKEIFKRLKDLPLIDKYEAYQLLDDEWTTIEADLEIIQSDGFEAVKMVDPNMVMKKKDGKDQEVQEGWVGRILPFELVQHSLLKADYERLQASEVRLSELDGELTEILDSFSDEEKEGDSFNDDKDGFVPAELAKEAKQIKADIKKAGAKTKAPDEDSYEARILKADELFGEQKTLKKDIKAEETALHAKTKETIEALSDEVANRLLEEKWIQPLVNSLHKLPDEIITILSSRVLALSEKYESTYKDLMDETQKTEKELSALIDELTGSDYDLKGLAEFQKLL
ncbi:MAG TPA: type I restriction-modification system subunit M, partial [Spirochaetia bacterium]|nr:type I restriction-modification system subunit M [Spirochaetia bacterium]